MGTVCCIASSPVEDCSGDGDTVPFGTTAVIEEGSLVSSRISPARRGGSNKIPSTLEALPGGAAMLLPVVNNDVGINTEPVAPVKPQAVRRSSRHAGRVKLPPGSDFHSVVSRGCVPLPSVCAPPPAQSPRSPQSLCSASHVDDQLPCISRALTRPVLLDVPRRGRGESADDQARRRQSLPAASTRSHQRHPRLTMLTPHADELSDDNASFRRCHRDSTSTTETTGSVILSQTSGTHFFGALSQPALPIFGTREPSP